MTEQRTFAEVCQSLAETIKMAAETADAGKDLAAAFILHAATTNETAQNLRQIREAINEIR